MIENRRRIRVLCASLLITAFFIATGCSGPQLRITDLQIHEYSDSQIRYTVAVTNVDTITRRSCRVTEADGDVYWQAYLSASQDPAETDKIPAGGVRIVSQSIPSIRNTLPPGESVTNTLNATAAVDPIRYPYLYVDLISKTDPGGTRKSNWPCAKWNDARVISLCDFTPPTAGGLCNATFDPDAVDRVTWDQYKPVACAPPTSPLFADAGPNDVFEFELQADFDVINDLSITRANQNLAQSAGTLRYVDPVTHLPVAIPITLKARGKSRYSHCAFRPLKIVFASAQTGNIFEGASRKIKVVTHCGNHPTSPWILGGTPEVQRRRLLSEYYFYQVLETLGSTALSTRLAHITYRNNDGTVIISEYAFLREREDDTCVRCGFVDEAEDFDVLTPDQTSVFQGTLYNKFVYNNDYVIVGGHNTRRCKDVSMNGFYIPYDWDLTGVVRPDYFKNGGVNYTDNVTNLWNWLSTQTPEVRTKAQAWHFVNHDRDMRRVLQDTLLDTEGQALMKGWYHLYMCTMKCFLGMK